MRKNLSKLIVMVFAMTFAFLLVGCDSNAGTQKEYTITYYTNISDKVLFTETAPGGETYGISYATAMEKLANDPIYTEYDINTLEFYSDKECKNQIDNYIEEVKGDMSIYIKLRKAPYIVQIISADDDKVISEKKLPAHESITFEIIEYIDSQFFISTKIGESKCYDAIYEDKECTKEITYPYTLTIDKDINLYIKLRDSQKYTISYYASFSDTLVTTENIYERDFFTYYIPVHRIKIFQELKDFYEKESAKGIVEPGLELDETGFSYDKKGYDRVVTPLTLTEDKKVYAHFKKSTAPDSDDEDPGEETIELGGDPAIFPATELKLSSDGLEWRYDNKTADVYVYYSSTNKVNAKSNFWRFNGDKDSLNLVAQGTKDGKSYSGYYFRVAKVNSSGKPGKLSNTIQWTAPMAAN